MVLADDSTIRILVVDDLPIYGQGLTRLLADQPDMEMTGEASIGIEAVRGFHRTAGLVEERGQANH